MQKVEAIKNRTELHNFNNSLLIAPSGKKRRYAEVYFDAWNFGVNVALRISDLSVLKFSDIYKKDDSYFIKVIERKTSKPRIINLNKKALGIFQTRRSLYPKRKYLFSMAGDKLITRQAYSRRFKQAAIDCGIDRPISTHSMRKTRGWVLYSEGIPVETISRVLNHSSTSTTLLYLGITDDEVNQTYIDFEI